MENPKFQIFQSKSNKKFYFRLRARNGKIVLSGSEGYSSKQSCKNGIKSVSSNAKSIKNFECKEGKTFTFRLRAKNNEIIGKSQSYKSKRARDNGVKSVQESSKNAPVEDLS